MNKKTEKKKLSEKTLKEQIKHIQSDSTLSNDQKQHNIQYVLKNEYNTPPADDNPVNDLFPEIECCYYPERKCKLQCVICKHYYHCRFCHNEKEDHKFDRHNVENVQCNACKTIQSPYQRCSNCDIEFGKFYCEICHLYAETLNVYHCEGCGICRKGPEEDFRHCDVCKMCISVNMKTHKCFENTFEGNCAICGDCLFDVIGYGSLLQCGHAIHQECMKQYVGNNYRCPLCKQSMVDMSATWNDLSERWKDALLVRDDNKIVSRFCNDCCETFENSFSPFMLYQCPECKGFNNC
jgi:RING finger/CHY zinc finger protein 1